MEQELQQVTQLYTNIMTYLVTYAFQIVAAIIILILGVLLGRKVSALVLGLCSRRGWDVTLSNFFASCARIAVIASALVIALPKLGIQVTPFLAAIGALGLGAGLALQGLLSNYGAGLSIILSRLFVVGDTIKVQGVAGQVKEVRLSYTLLTTEDNETITIPNKHIIGEIIHNSQADTIIELTVGIAYASDPRQAIRVIRDALQSLPGLSAARTPQVGIHGFGDSAIDIGIRLWARTEQVFEVRYQANLAIFEALKAAAIEIPFPQRDVHLHNG